MNGFLIISIISSTLFLSAPFIKNIENSFSNNIEISLSNDIVKNSFEKKVKEHFSDRRYTEIFIALDKFKTYSTKEKIFGTGWYTSRITLANFEDKYTNSYSDRFSL